MEPHVDNPALRAYFEQQRIKKSRRPSNYIFPTLHPDVDLSYCANFQIKRYRAEILAALTPDPNTTYPFCLVCGYAEDQRALVVRGYELGEHPEYPFDIEFVGLPAAHFGSSRFKWYDHILRFPHRYYLQCANCEHIYRSTSSKVHRPRPHTRLSQYSRRNLISAIAQTEGHPLQEAARTFLEVFDIERAFPRTPGTYTGPTYDPKYVRETDLRANSPAFLLKDDPRRWDEPTKAKALRDSQNAELLANIVLGDDSESSETNI